MVESKKKIVRVNLGCGEDYKEGWINVDYNKKVKADIYSDFLKKLPFKDNSVDFIYAKNIFEHVPNPLDFLFEIKRVLKKGGKVSLITDNASYFIFHFPRKKAYHDTYDFGINDRHYFFFQRKHLVNFAEKAGMKLVHLDYSILRGSTRRNYNFQKFMAYLIGKKFAYENWLWVMEKN